MINKQKKNLSIYIPSDFKKPSFLSVFFRFLYKNHCFTKDFLHEQIQLDISLIFASAPSTCGFSDDA